MNEARESSIAIDSGQGLSVELQLAGLGARSYAFLVDWHIRVVAALGWILLCVATGWLAQRLGLGGPPRAAAALIMLTPAAGIYLLYHPLLEVLMQGSTPGKRMAGVRILLQDGRTAPLSAHLLRNLFRLVDGLPMFYCVGVVSCLLTRRQVRIGDIAVGAVLVYVSYDGKELRRAIGRHVHRGKLDPELLRVGADMLARWKELDEVRRRELAMAVLARLGEAASDDLDLAQLQTRLGAVLAAAE